MKRKVAYITILLFTVTIGFFLSNLLESKSNIDSKSLLKILQKCGKVVNNDLYRDCLAERVVSIADNYNI